MGNIMEVSELVGSIRNFYQEKNKLKTLRHVEEVAETAVWLAGKNNMDSERVRIAALLHDISVIMTPQEMYEAIKERNMPIDPAEEKYHFLLHQRVSKLIAKEQLGIHDEAILSAVECHTTLKKDAGVFDKIIFIADKISWDQEGTPPYYEMLKELAWESLDDACFYYINYQFENRLLLMPHRWIEEAYEDLKVKLKMGI